MGLFMRYGLIALAIAPIMAARAEMLSLERDGSAQIVAQVRNAVAAQSAMDDGSTSPVLFSFNSEAGQQVVSIGKRLPLTVKEEGITVNISQHLGYVNGLPAVITMDEATVRINFSRRDGDNTQKIHAAMDGNQVQERAWQNETRQTEDPHPIDLQLETPPELVESEEGIDSGVANGSQPITIFVFKHDDVRETVSSLTEIHFSWWLVQMASINDRYIAKGKGSLFSEVVIDFRSDRQIQSFGYRGNPSERLRGLAKEFQRYKRESGIVGSYRRNKFLLLTEKMMNWKTLGIAYVGGQYGMASDDIDQVAAHEIGHMFNGRHEHADVWYNGWWCETILYWQHVPLRGSCQEYTDKNMDTIADYLN